MTNAQYNLLLSLTGSVDSLLATCEAAGFEMVKNCGKSAKIKDIMSIDTKDASEIISSLGRKLAPAGTRDNLVSEGQEINGYMVDRGEDN